MNPDDLVNYLLTRPIPRRNAPGFTPADISGTLSGGPPAVGFRPEDIASFLKTRTTPTPAMASVPSVPSPPTPDPELMGNEQYPPQMGDPAGGYRLPPPAAQGTAGPAGFFDRVNKMNLLAKLAAGPALNRAAAQKQNDAILASYDRQQAIQDSGRAAGQGRNARQYEQALGVGERRGSGVDAELTRMVAAKRAADARGIDPQAGRWARMMAAAPAMTQTQAEPLAEPNPLAGVAVRGVRGEDGKLRSVRLTETNAADDEKLLEDMRQTFEKRRRATRAAGMTPEVAKEISRGNSTRLAYARGVLNPTAAEQEMGGALKDRQAKMMMLQIAMMKAGQQVNPRDAETAAILQSMTPEERKQFLMGAVGIQPGAPGLPGAGAPTTPGTPGMPSPPPPPPSAALRGEGTPGMPGPDVKIERSGGTGGMPPGVNLPGWDNLSDRVKRFLALGWGG